MNTETRMDEKKARAKPLRKHLRRLYELEARIHGLDPWKWLAPADIFGIHREGCDPLFVCFHEIAGFKAVDIGLGWRSYHMLLHVHARKIHDPAFYFENRMFQFGRLDPKRVYDVEAAHYNRDAVATPDGLVPYFRSHQVGRAPWPVNRAEAVFLADVLYIIFGMAMRVEDFSEPLGSRAMEEVYVMPVAADGAPGEPRWEPVPPVPAEPRPEAAVSADVVKRVRGLPAGSRPMEMDHVFLPLFPGKHPANTPPRTGYLFLFAVGRRGGADISAFVLHADGDLSNVWPRLPAHVLKVMAAQPARPPEIRVADSRLMALLRPLTELLPVKLTRAENLPLIERESPGIINKMGLRNDG